MAASHRPRWTLFVNCIWCHDPQHITHEVLENLAILPVINQSCESFDVASNKSIASVRSGSRLVITYTLVSKA
ncbi:hypothetical protein E6O75_ATG05587 [Venturia nashicola]|uniref:Uncharacterized protein n=1 Tax=Venturia nashicola TaxID=86259 RepID=A0A4Z1PFU2_9PEZI|nr:hypothetical protein E6O75_ATG05587 [Venturia nashicola]